MSLRVCVYGYVRACARVGVDAGRQACACARVNLLIQLAARRHIVICSLYGSTTCFDSISQTAWFL